MDHKLSDFLEAFPVDYKEGYALTDTQRRDIESSYTTHFDPLLRYLTTGTEIERIRKAFSLKVLPISEAIREFQGMREANTLTSIKEEAEELNREALYIGGTLCPVPGVPKPSLQEVNGRIANKEALYHEDILLLLEEVIKSQLDHLYSTLVALDMRRSTSYALDNTAGLVYIPLEDGHVYVVTDLFEGLSSEHPDRLGTTYTRRNSRFHFEHTRKFHHIKDFKKP